MKAGVASNQDKIDRLRARSADSYIFACQAAVPLIFTPDLLYQLWNNFKQYHYSFEPGEYYKIPHIAVSDLILSSFCREVGHELYEIEKDVRDILLQDLVLLLGEKRKNTIAIFLNNYALLEHHYTHRKGLKEIHLLTAQSVLNPADMERQIIERINAAETDAEKIDYLLLHHNLMPLGFESDLSAISRHLGGNGLSPVLIPEGNLNAPGVLNVILPVELSRKIRTAGKPVIELTAEPDKLFEDTKIIYEKESLLRRALDEDMRNFGTNHPNVATDLRNLGLLMQETNRLEEAEPLLRRALEIDERTFGTNHPNVARDLNNLGLLLQATNRLAEAEPLLRRALEIDELNLQTESSDKKRSFPKKRILLLYDFYTDHENEVLKKLKNGLASNNVDIISSIPDEGLSMEKLKSQNCDGMIIFYGDADPQWFLYRQSIFIGAATDVKIAVCLAGTDIEKKLNREVMKGIDVITDDNFQSGIQKFLDRIGLLQPESKTGYEYDVYISYNSRSAEYMIDQFLPLLTSEFENRYLKKIKIFLNKEIRLSEQQWPEVITHALIHSKIVLALLTPEYFSSPVNLVEWSTFTERSQETRSELILPVILINGNYLDKYLEKERLRIDLSEFYSGSKSFQVEATPKNFLEQISLVPQQINDLLQNVPPFNPGWTIADDKLISRFKENHQLNPSPSSENEYAAKNDTSRLRTIQVYMVPSSAGLAIDIDVLRKYITQENDRFRSKEIYVNLVIWEYDSTFSSDNFQNEVRKIVKECDMLVGLIFSKIDKYALYAYEYALEEYTRKHSPIIYTYFKYAGITIHPGDLKNTKTTHDLRERLRKMGHFYSDYETTDELILNFSFQLEKVVQQLDATNVASTNLIYELALEYESTRKAMTGSDERTVAMEVIKNKMSLIARDIITMLPLLTNSKSPGERLAAITCLQKFPQPEYFDWLAIHVGDAEKHFIGYHAAVALEAAVQQSGIYHYKYLLGCIDLAIKNVETAKRKDYNQLSVLNKAKKTLTKTG